METGTLNSEVCTLHANGELLGAKFCVFDKERAGIISATIFFHRFVIQSRCFLYMKIKVYRTIILPLVLRVGLYGHET
jgi:hypothetical protein